MIVGYLFGYLVVARDRETLKHNTNDQLGTAVSSLMQGRHQKPTLLASEERSLETSDHIW